MKKIITTLLMISAFLSSSVYASPHSHKEIMSKNPKFAQTIQSQQNAGSCIAVQGVLINMYSNDKSTQAQIKKLQAITWEYVDEFNSSPNAVEMVAKSIYPRINNNQHAFNLMVNNNGCKNLNETLIKIYLSK